jgi:hypothetical protein
MDSTTEKSEFESGGIKMFYCSIFSTSYPLSTEFIPHGMENNREA